jgi:HAD superfamily hydrolase (TIGR01490 family)
VTGRRSGPAARGRARQGRAARGRPAAFFDVDGTLTRMTTMFDFLEFHLSATGRPEEYTRLRERMNTLAAAGADRVRTCREYYLIYAGEAESELLAQGERWFRSRIRDTDLFLPAALAAFRAHAAAGHLTVLVSGSFPACLDPLARLLSADVVLCSNPEIRDGRHTGAIAIPMIGEAKAAAIHELSARYAIALDSSYAYGDHSSDIPMLNTVATPVAVGEDPELLDYAISRGWQRVNTPEGNRS